MEVDGWRLTPFSSVPPDARALALDDPSAPSQTSAEATVDVEIGRRFWLNLTHPAFVAEPNQYELELSAGGNRISHALLDLGSSADGEARPVDVWLDGSGELGAVAFNSEAALTGVVGAWEWMGVDADEDPLNVQSAASSGLSGALVLRLFSIASRKDGPAASSQEPAPRASSPPDDRDASQVLSDFLAARTSDKSRRAKVDLCIRPQDVYSSVETPSSSHPLKPLRSSLKSLKPAAATFVLGFRIASLDPPNVAATEPESAPHSLEGAASTATHGHPTPPPSARNRSTPSSASATYSRKESKKRARARRAESVSSASDTAEGSTPNQQETFQPVTPLPRGAAKPSSAKETKAAFSSASRLPGQASISSEQTSSAGTKRRKTVQTALVLPATSPPVGSGRGPLSTPTAGRPSSASKATAGSPTSTNASRRKKDPSADPMQLVASGDEMDDEIQVVEVLSTVQAVKRTKSLDKPQGLSSPDLQMHGRPARRTLKSSNGSSAAQPKDVHQGLLVLGDSELFEQADAGKDSAAAFNELLNASGIDFDEFVPAPNNLFSSAERPPASQANETYTSSAVTAGPSGASTQGAVVESQSAAGEELDLDYAAFFTTQSGEAQGPSLRDDAPSTFAGADAQAPSAAGVNHSSRFGELAPEVKDESEGPVSAPRVRPDHASPTEGKVEGSDREPSPIEMDGANLPPLDRDIWVSVHESIDNAVNQATKNLTHEACKIDFDLLRRFKIDLSDELNAIRNKLYEGCQAIVITGAFGLLPSLSAVPFEPAPTQDALPVHMSDLREALHRIIFNATVRHKTDLYNRFQSVWEPSFPGDVLSIVEKQHEETVQAMREKVAQALRAIQRGR